MKKIEPWPVADQLWDTYRAFHVGVGKWGTTNTANYHQNNPFILFDTDELILTTRMPDPGERGAYNASGVELTKSDELTNSLWTPDGLEIKKAWFQDNGSQWILIDDLTGRAVRTDVVVQTRDRKIERPNIPARFQSCAAYIGGPGCHPVGVGKFVIRPTINVMPKAEQEKIKQLEQTFRAHMTLIEHEVTTRIPAGSGVSYERMVAVSSWEELNNNELLQLWSRGVARPMLEYDYLLSERPR